MQFAVGPFLNHVEVKVGGTAQERIDRVTQHGVVHRETILAPRVVQRPWQQAEKMVIAHVLFAVSDHVESHCERQEGGIILPFHRPNRLDQLFAPRVQPVHQFLTLIEAVGGVNRPNSALNIPVGGKVRPLSSHEPETGCVHETPPGTRGAAKAVNRLPVERIEALVWNS